MENTFVKHDRRSPVARVLKWTGLIIGGIALAVLLAFIFGYFVMLLWNWLMPALFGLPEIDYWMAFGIIILAKLLFGGIGHHHHDKHHTRHPRVKNWRNGMKHFPHSSRWDYYDDYWRDEGEKSFNEYVRRKQEGEAGSSPAT
jgi:high-affinity Fe2+/Pb2+ permease